MTEESGYSGIRTVGDAWLIPARTQRRWGYWLKMRREFVPHGWGLSNWWITEAHSLEDLVLIAGREGKLRV